ncbi:MAG: hypothetical protein H6825_08745 [Planctomycetes bacterium]|nr:hypothetical protein [Planctomycetota bacterium]
MDPTGDRAPLRELLDAVERRTADRLERVARRPRDAGSGTLLGAFARHHLSDVEVLLVLASLVARLDGQRALLGSELAAACDGPAERLAALGLLTGDGALVSRGFLVPEVVPGHPAEAHGVSYRLGEHAFRLACEAFGEPPRATPGALTGPYRTNAEVLSDLRRLSLHYRRRAARVFHLDPWTGTGIEVLDTTASLLHRARVEAARVLDRLAHTERPERFPILVLRGEHDLDLDALVILVTVLFQELVEGVGSVDAVDLVKLVSESEAELIARRMLLRPLARKGLLRLEGSYAGKDLTADASLPNAVIEQLTGAVAPIGADDRLDFHAFLEQLDGSDTFFLEMDGGETGG